MRTHPPQGRFLPGGTADVELPVAVCSLLALTSGLITTPATDAR